LVISARLAGIFLLEQTVPQSKKIDNKRESNLVKQMLKIVCSLNNSILTITPIGGEFYAN